MSEHLAEQRATLQPRIDEALGKLGALTDEGGPFELVLVPSADELEAQVLVDNAWARGLLYATVVEYLEQLLANWSTLPKPVGRAIASSAHWRQLRFRIDDADGGLVAPVVMILDGRLDLVFKANALKTNHAGWSDVGLDVNEALARIGATPVEADAAAPPNDAPAPEPEPEPRADFTAAIDAHLQALGELVGDGVPWRYEWATSADAMDAEVTSHRSDLKGKLHETLEKVLGYLVDNLRRDASPEDVGLASPARTLVFSFAAIDDLPRPYLGFFQAVLHGETLHFVGPADDFHTYGSNTRIGRDLEKALQAARGETGPTEKERRLAESLAAIAGTSSSGAKSEGKTCRMCDGTGLGTCTPCHGKGGPCNVCKGSGRSKAKCPSCKGAGVK